MNPLQSTFKVLAAFWLLCTVAHATVTINATLVDQQGHAVPFAYLEVKLVDCGYNIPSVVSAPASIVIKDQKFTPSQLPATIYGNNEIACGNSYSTLYHVTAWRDSSTKLSGDNDYDICSNATNCLVAAAPSWNLAQSQPFTGSAPPPGFASIYGNPLLSQTWNQPAGTSATLNGTFIFNGNTLFNQLSPGNCVQAGANGVLTTVGFPCGQGGQGGGGAWNNNGTPTGNLALNTTTFLSTFTSGDFGNSPVNGIFSYVSGSTSVGDTSTLMRLSVPANSYQNPFYVDVNGFAQLQVANLAGSSHIGAVVMGSAIAASSLSSAFQSKAYILSAGATANPLTLMHTSTSQSSALFRMHSASSSATNFDFAYACTGASAVDGSCPSANYQWRLHADGSSFQNGAVNAGPTPATACGNPLAGGATNCLAMRTSSGAVVPGVGQNTLRFTAGGPQCSINGAGETSCLGGGSGISGTPLVTQTVTQPVSTSLNANTFNSVRYVTPSFNWSQTLASNWATPGAQTATLTPCPAGIDLTNNTNQPYKAYIPTTNPEVVTPTGGTCTPGAATGTITFTTALVHSASSNQIGSSTAGLQETINDACGTATGTLFSNPNCSVIVPPTGANANAAIIQAPIFLHASHVTLDGNGALLKCATRDKCLFLGDLSSPNHYTQVVVKNLNFGSSVVADGCLISSTQRISNVVTITATGCATILTGDTVNINFTDDTRFWGAHGPVTVSGSSITYAQTGPDLPSIASPGTIAIQDAAIEDNALPATIDGVGFSSAFGANFNQGLVIDNDQAADIRNINYSGSALRCTPNHCASVIYSTGSTQATPVIWLSKSNLSPQCGANGITNLANNTTHISDTVIQGTAIWGTQTTTILGSFGGTQMDNVYNETGNCTGSFHPYYPSSSYAVNNAGLIFEGGANFLTVRGGEQSNGKTPSFKVVNVGATRYNYYIIVNDTTIAQHSTALYAGYALTTGTGNVTVQWPHVPPQTPGDTVTYDIIRMQAADLWSGTPNFPVMNACTGGSAIACGSVATAQAQCAGLVCTFTDSASASTTSYADSTFAGNIWLPVLPYWPGGVIMTGNGASSGSYGAGKAIFDTDTGSANDSPWISVIGYLAPSFVLSHCSGTPSGAQFGGAWKECFDGDSVGSTSPGVGATVLQNAGFQAPAPAGLKGRLNFNTGRAGISQNHIITLVDSNALKTLATAQSRPAADANDTYIGLDQSGATTNLAQLAFGAPVAISSYIGNTGNNTSWLERLTASLKTFNVPLSIPGFQLGLTAPGYVAVPMPAGYVAGNDLCPTIKTATDANTFAIIDLRAFPTKFYCNSPMTTAQTAGGLFNGWIILPASAIFMNSTAGFQAFGSGVHVIGMGRTTGSIYSEGTGTTFELCTAVVAGKKASDWATYCHSTNYTAPTPGSGGAPDANNYVAMICASNYPCSDGASHLPTLGTGFATEISGIDIGVEQGANVEGYANFGMQELTYFTDWRIHNCNAANDVCLSVGDGFGGPQNTFIGNGQISTAVDWGGATPCLNDASAVPIRIDTSAGSNGNPHKIEDVSVVNNCANGTQPKYDLEYASGANAHMDLTGVHLESASVAGIAEGVSTILGVDVGKTANGLKVSTSDCGNGTMAACALLYSNATLTGAAVTNAMFVNFCEANAGVTNTIDDKNNVAVPQATAPCIVRFETDKNKKVAYDSSGVNPSIMAGVLHSANTYQVTTNYTGAGDTSPHNITGLTSPTITAGTTVTIHCAGQYSITTGTAQLSLAMNASQTPVNISSQATIATNTATASYPNSVSNGGALTGATVGAFGNHFGFVVDATIFWHASLAGTVSLQAATSNASDVPVIYQGAYCSILP